VSRDSDTVPVLRCIEVSQQNYVKGQSRRFRPHPTMSALTPITTKPATRHDGRKGPMCYGQIQFTLMFAKAITFAHFPAALVISAPN